MFVGGSELWGPDAARLATQAYFELPAPALLETGYRNDWIVRPFLMVIGADDPSSSKVRCGTRCVVPEWDAGDSKGKGREVQEPEGSHIIAEINCTLWDDEEQEPVFEDTKKAYSAAARIPFDAVNIPLLKGGQTKTTTANGKSSSGKGNGKCKLYTEETGGKEALSVAISRHIWLGLTCIFGPDDLPRMGALDYLGGYKDFTDAVPPLGTFRPARIFIHDSGLAGMVQSWCDVTQREKDDPKKAATTSAAANGGPLPPLPPSLPTVSTGAGLITTKKKVAPSTTLASKRKSASASLPKWDLGFLEYACIKPEPDYSLAGLPQQKVCVCAFCWKVGCERPGMIKMIKMLRCGACSFTW